MTPPEADPEPFLMPDEIRFDMPIAFTSVSRDVPFDHYSRVSGLLALAALNKLHGFANGEIPFDTPKDAGHAAHVAATSNLLRGCRLRVTLRVLLDGSFELVRAEIL